MREHMALFLGLWHPVKQANILIWQRYAPILMQIFHDLWPTGLYVRKPRLTTIVNILTVVRLAYPEARAELQAAACKQGVTQAQRAAVLVDAGA